jgi:hypothetical protein
MGACVVKERGTREFTECTLSDYDIHAVWLHTGVLSVQSRTPLETRRILCSLLGFIRPGHHLPGAMPSAASMVGPAQRMKAASLSSSPGSMLMRRAAALPAGATGLAPFPARVEAAPASTLTAATSASDILLRSSGTWHDWVWLGTCMAGGMRQHADQRTLPR